MHSFQSTNWHCLSSGRFSVLSKFISFSILSVCVSVYFLFCFFVAFCMQVSVRDNGGGMECRIEKGGA